MDPIDDEPSSQTNNGFILAIKLWFFKKKQNLIKNEMKLIKTTQNVVR